MGINFAKWLKIVHTACVALTEVLKTAQKVNELIQRLQPKSGKQIQAEGKLAEETEDPEAKQIDHRSNQAETTENKQREITELPTPARSAREENWPGKKKERFRENGEKVATENRLSDWFPPKQLNKRRNFALEGARPKISKNETKMAERKTSVRFHKEEVMSRIRLRVVACYQGYSSTPFHVHIEDPRIPRRRREAMTFADHGFLNAFREQFGDRNPLNQPDVSEYRNVMANARVDMMVDFVLEFPAESQAPIRIIFDPDYASIIIEDENFIDGFYRAVGNINEVVGRRFEGIDEEDETDSEGEEDEREDIIECSMGFVKRYRRRRDDDDEEGQGGADRTIHYGRQTLAQRQAEAERASGQIKHEVVEREAHAVDAHEGQDKECKALANKMRTRYLIHEAMERLEYMTLEPKWKSRRTVSNLAKMGYTPSKHLDVAIQAMIDPQIRESRLSCRWLKQKSIQQALWMVGSEDEYLEEKEVKKLFAPGLAETWYIQEHFEAGPDDAEYICANGQELDLSSMSIQLFGDEYYDSEEEKANQKGWFDDVDENSQFW